MVGQNRIVFALRVSIVAVIGFLASPSMSLADAVFGEKFKLRQPDGSLVEVRIWGDEFHQVVESLDGYTLVRDPATGVICYARVSEDSRQLISTGRKIGTADPAILGLTRHQRVSPQATRAAVSAAKAAYFPESAGPVPQAPGAGEVLPAATTLGNVQGICLIVDFSDDPGTILSSEVDNYCNQVGYTGFGNNGSVRDYFYGVSIGRLTYTNYVPAQYYRAVHPKTYYDDKNVSYGTRARELVIEALNWLDASGFDFSQYDSDHNGRVDGINCFYAGTTSAGWAEGLWPHAGSITWSADGVSTSRYQITDMRTSLRLSTFCHENGHMICGWPDLYDYDYDSRGVGNFCLMCYSGSSVNPVHPCAYLKHIAGWTETTVLTGPQTNLPLTAGTNSIYKYNHPTLSTEYYLIENRQKTGRDASLPDSGLALWHIDVNGSNNNQQMTPSSHYKVTLVQADGRWDLEHNVNYGDSTDLWGAPTYVQCGPTTTPNTNWWSGAASELSIFQISAPATTMTFSFGMCRILLNPTVISHNLLPGGTVSPDNITVANEISSFPMSYTIEYDPAWLTVSPTSGSSSGESDPITLTYNNTVISAWPKGTYTTNVTVSSPNATNSPQTLAVTIIVETVGPDFNGDMDVDQSDFGHMQACLSGGMSSQTDPACQNAKFDADEDVDQQDLLIFRGCMSGPGVPVDLDCESN